VESLVPKSKYGFRAGHQIYLTDGVLFTAATLTIARSVEQRRHQSAFSYRFDQKPMATSFPLIIATGIGCAISKDRSYSTTTSEKWSLQTLPISTVASTTTALRIVSMTMQAGQRSRVIL
jgi:hypothetical protein